MKIAICDTDLIFIKSTKNSIYQYANKYRMDLYVKEFYTGEELLSDNSFYNIIIIDYKLTGINGLETIKRIRKSGINSTVIFASNFTEFVFDSFKVNPYRFLIKPINNNEIYATLNDYFDYFGKDYPLWIKSGDETLCLNTADIMYLEADNKYCFLSVQNEKISCHKTIAKVFEKLPKNSFCKINRAFIINMNYIKKYNNDCIWLKNNESLHISRNYLKSFKAEYNNYLKPLIP